MPGRHSSTAPQGKIPVTQPPPPPPDVWGGVVLGWGAVVAEGRGEGSGVAVVTVVGTAEGRG